MLEWVSFDGKAHSVHSSEEVILSAGAIVSSQLLELSGVGYWNFLGKYGIECKMENPDVGEGCI